MNCPRKKYWITIPLALLFSSSCATSESKYETTLASALRPIVRGETKQALASYESQAQETEKNAAASTFPEYYWAVAAGAYTAAANAAWFSGQLQKSITYGEKALELAAKGSEPVLEMRAAASLVNIYRSVRNFDKAREVIEKGFKTVKNYRVSIDRYIWESNLYLHVGEELMRQRDYEKAIDSFSQSASLVVGLWAFPKPSPGKRQHLTHYLFVWGSEQEKWEWIRNHELVTLAHLGHAYRQAGKLQQALEQYQRVFSLIKESGQKYPFEAELYEGMGDIYFRQRNFPLALENFNKALPLAENQQRPVTISSVSSRIGDVMRESGKQAEAVAHYQKAIQQIESMRSLLESQEYRQSYFEGGLEAYINMMDALLAAGKHEEAFNYGERARSRVFLDILGSKVQLSRAKSGLLEEETTLNEHIAALKAMLADKEGETQRESLRRELEQAERTYNALLSKVRKEDKEQASLMTVEPLTLKEVQELLDPETTLIEYFVTEPNILVWVVQKDKVQHVAVRLGKKKLSYLVKTLRETIFTLGEKEKFNEVSTSLYKHLIEPLLPHISGKELVLVPHDVLHYLPFQALYSPQGRYLIEEYSLSYLSSASLLQFTTAKRKAKGEKVLAFGNPDLGDPSKNLRFAELEAKEIQRFYPKSTVLLKNEATEEKGKSLSSQHDILHFATHAELNEDDPLSSAILLAKEGKEDGRLEVKEVFGMNLNASLVVLSACETGLGKLSSGDELVGLTRAFIYAGTPSVVASLWKVEDSSTAALMGSFYRNLRTMSKVEALRQAQLELIRGQGGSSDLLARRGVGGIGKLGEIPKAKPQSPPPVSASVPTSHPFFWAPFILVGDGK